MDCDIPYLTIDDKINTFILEGKDIPALIVEGQTDFEIYSRLLLKSSLDWSKIDIVVGKSKSQILEYHDNGLPFSYIALLDADYERHNSCCRIEPKLLYTHFYNMENYLTTIEVIEETINDFRTISSSNIKAEQIIFEAISSIEPYIIACLLKNKNSWSIKLEDYSIKNEQWWDKRKKCVDVVKMGKYISSSLNLLGVSFSEMDWNASYKDGQAILQSIFSSSSIDLVVNGKRKLEAIFFRFKKYFPTETAERNEKVLQWDLCKNIMKSSHALDLVNQIDSKFMPLLGRNG